VFASYLANREKAKKLWTAKKNEIALVVVANGNPCGMKKY